MHRTFKTFPNLVTLSGSKYSIDLSFIWIKIKLYNWRFLCNFSNPFLIFDLRAPPTNFSQNFRMFKTSWKFDADSKTNLLLQLCPIRSNIQINWFNIWAVGKTVDSETRGPWFESSQQQIFIMNIFTVKCSKDENKEKRGREMHIKKVIVLWRYWIGQWFEALSKARFS